MPKKRVTSGMRPTGSLHLGNLLGALENWVSLQDKYDCYFFIVDWHSLTTPGGGGAVGYENIGELKDNIHEIAIDWISAGLDPEKCSIFIQSFVPEVAELYLILSMVTPLGWLERNPTYREMVKSYAIESPSYGLLGYPTLQSADILLYKGDFVPVGKDQEAHINMTKDLAARFNNLYNRNVFPLTEALLAEVPKVPGIDSVNKKMSKSSGNHISLSLGEEETIKRIKTMFTDPVKIRKDDPGHPDGCVVYAFHKIYNSENLEGIYSECKSGKRGCVDCKMQLAVKLNESLRPIREKRKELEKKPEIIADILESGASTARGIARDTLEEVRDAMKLPTRGIFNV